MASAFTHAFVGVLILETLRDQKKMVLFWVLAVLCSVLPDIDVVGFKFGVPYESLWGHRGMTHSLFFAALLGWLVVDIFFRDERRFSRAWWLLWTCFFLVTASHGILDAMTNGGLGVAFFAPFDNSRYFFPWRPVLVSPIWVDRFFGERAYLIIVSEFLWIWIPALALVLVAKLGKKSWIAWRAQ
jgi:inner membrane protein